MKKLLHSFLAIMLVLTVGISLTGCGKYKYNYNGEHFKFQYDKDKYIVDYAEDSTYTDVFVHTNDGYYLAYVDVSLFDKNYGEARDILDNLQSYFASKVTNPVISDEYTNTTKSSYDYQTKMVEEYNYVITTENSKQIIKSRVETVGVQQFVVVERYFDGVYDKSVINGLDLIYDSATPIY